MKTVAIGVFVAVAAVAHAEGASVPLGGKAALAVPTPFTLQRELPLPPNLVRASMFGRPDGEHLLVNVTKPDPRACQVRLDEGITLGKEALKDPAAAQLFRFDVLELRTMSRHKVVYSEGATRSAAVAQAGGAFISIVSVSFCVEAATVSLTLSLPPGAAASARDRAMLAAMVASIP